MSPNDDRTQTRAALDGRAADAAGTSADGAPAAPLAPSGPARPVQPRPRSVRSEQPVAHRRPDPSPMRLALGFAGLAAATAVTTAVIAPAGARTVTATTVPQPVAATPAPSVRHVIRYVHLKPGQTPPPSAVVAAPLPAPTPRVVVITTTQSGVVKP